MTSHDIIVRPGGSLWVESQLGIGSTFYFSQRACLVLEGVSKMVVITDKEDVFTAINVFTVSPPDQPRLLKNLYEFIDKFVKPCEGFISASLHRSEDGRRVINYAQWESREAWLEMENNPTISKAMEEQFTIAPHADFNIYSVAAVIEHL